MIDTAVDLDTILKIGEIGSIIGSVAVALFAFGRASTKFQMNLEAMREDMIDLKTDLKKLNEVIVSVAVQNGRLDLIAERLNQLDTRWDELRHGKGLIVGDDN